MSSSLAKFNVQMHKSYTKHRKIDPRPDLGESLEPFAHFDSDLEKFCCHNCNERYVTFRGIDAHLATTSCGPKY